VAPKRLEVLVRLVVRRRKVGLDELDIVELDELVLLVDRGVGPDPDDAVGRLLLLAGLRLDLDRRARLESRVGGLVELGLVDREGHIAVFDDARPYGIALVLVRIAGRTSVLSEPGAGTAQGHHEIESEPNMRHEPAHESLRRAVPITGPAATMRGNWGTGAAL